MSKYIVMTASAQMPSSCWGTYRKAAIVELEDGFGGSPSMISKRARGVKRIVKLRDRLHVGKTNRCEYARVVRDLHSEAEQLNAGA